MNRCLSPSTGVSPLTTTQKESCLFLESSSEEELQPTSSWVSRLGQKAPRISRDMSSSSTAKSSEALNAFQGLPDAILRHVEVVLLKLRLIAARMGTSRSSVAYLKDKGIGPISTRLYLNFAMDPDLKRLRCDILKLTAAIETDCETLLRGVALARGGSQLYTGSGALPVPGSLDMPTQWTPDPCGLTAAMDGLTGILAKTSQYLTIIAMTSQRVSLFPSACFSSFWTDTPYRFLSRGGSSLGIQEELSSLQIDLSTICMKLSLRLKEKQFGGDLTL